MDAKHLTPTEAGGFKSRSPCLCAEPSGPLNYLPSCASLHPHHCAKHLTPGNLGMKFVPPNSPGHNTQSMGAAEGRCLLVCSGPLKRTQCRPTCLGMAPPISGEILLQELTIQKTPHRSDHRPIWLGQSAVEVPSAQVSLGWCQGAREDYCASRHNCWECIYVTLNFLSFWVSLPST